jgi:hypothetical protein
MKLIAFLVTYPLAGALFAAGALAVVHYAGAQQIKPLGRAGGEGFAEGIAAINAAKGALHV